MFAQKGERGDASPLIALLRSAIRQQGDVATFQTGLPTENDIPRRLAKLSDFDDVSVE